MRLKILAAALAASLLAGACGGEASQSADPDMPPPSQMTIYALRRTRQDRCPRQVTIPTAPSWRI